MSEKIKRPSFQFYPADWKKDANLQGCSLAARGLWIEIMCIAHQCELYGHLVINGQPMSIAQISRIAGATPGEVKRLLAELENAKVFSRSPTDAIYSRRMVTDEQLRNARAEGGKGGAEHGHKGAEHGAKGGRPRKLKGPVKPPLEPAPSSSSSSSNKGIGAFAPPDWVPAEQWTAWLEVRKKKRAPNTDHALQLAVAELAKLKAAGHDPKTVLEQSTFRGWAGLFEVKNQPSQLFAESSSRAIDLGNCLCGRPASMKVGGKPRCAAHARGFEAVAT